MQAGARRAKPPASNQFLKKRLSALMRALPGARAGEVTGIHQTRVATRRLREALPLLTGAAERRAERAVRRLTRALGPVRELDVALQTLDELQQARAISRPALLCLRQSIADERAARLRHAVEVIAHTDLTRVRAKVVTGQERRTRELAARAAVRQRVALRAARLERSVADAASLYLPERLHAVRLAVKKLRYALEVARQLGTPRRRGTSATRGTRTADGQLAVLKRVQELLGRMHDFEMLIARVRAVQSAAQAPSLRVSGDLDGVVRKLEMECRLLHGQYIAERPRVLALCDRLRPTDGQG